MRLPPPNQSEEQLSVHLLSLVQNLQTCLSWLSATLNVELDCDNEASFELQDQIKIQITNLSNSFERVLQVSQCCAFDRITDFSVL